MIFIHTLPTEFTLCGGGGFVISGGVVRDGSGGGGGGGGGFSGGAYCVHTGMYKPGLQKLV